METPLGVDTIWAQLQTVLAFLQRLVVQRQLFALLAAVGIAWLASVMLDRILVRLARRADPEPHGWSMPWEERSLGRTAIEMVVRVTFPILAIAAAYAASRLYEQQGWPNGLIQQAMWLLWAFVAYRLLMAVLYVAMGRRRVWRYQRRVLAPLFWLLIIWKILDFAISLDTIAQVQLLVLYGSPIDLGTLFMIAVVLYFLFSGSWAVQNLIRSEVIPRTDIEPGQAYGLLTVMRYLVIVAGSFFVLRALGFETSTLAFVSGGLSVAIAFGSQQVFANFVSGILLLFEQSLRPGDVISFGNEMGVVESLSIRATTVRTLDNVSLVVPNQSLLTSAVKNYTKDDPTVRVRVQVTVKYQGRLEELREALLAVARDYDTLRDEPAPQVLFPSMSLAKVTAELSVWISNALQIPEVSSELNRRVWNAVTESGFDLA
jgi:small-conductance mechanosensitive channel